MYSSADWRALCNINAKQAARRLADRQSGTGRDTDSLLRGTLRRRHSVSASATFVNTDYIIARHLTGTN